MSAPLPSLPVTFRPTRTRVVLYTVGIAQLAALTAIALLLPKLSGGERLSFVFTGLLVLAVLLLLSRPRVVARQEGITVINLTTRRELAWAQVLRVNLREGDPWVHLDLADGTSLPAMGIQPGIAKDQAIRDARALRDLTEKHGAVDHTAG
ncbi:PH domain-containing protein [Streptomyces decoyicus]|uniref:PH domain-containing protein n=1 Tax=Streptomyces decoyicus TaxID=249567 RepID=UPI00069D9A5E|nr:PH domain-containing protein [Streptomyces decoyicus]KOG37531.1 membrane protein [Streptomyces decoyicus]QZY14844.1 PH domain-containing protein [Streptomyces decoyicus]